MKSVVITGTDTDVGKTFISALLMAGLPEYRYWKPIQSGREPSTDSNTVRDLSGARSERILDEQYIFEAPLSPHAAAALEARSVDSAALSVVPPAPLIVEGAGGLLVPLNDDTLYIDMFVRWELPAIVVTRSTLGTINHTLLTLEALRRRNIRVLGCIVNGPRNPSNEQAIEQYGNVEILGVIERLTSVTPEILQRTFNERLGRLREVLQ
jgi:dethiobiotin synthetase